MNKLMNTIQEVLNRNTTSIAGSRDNIDESNFIRQSLNAEDSLPRKHGVFLPLVILSMSSVFPWQML